MHRSSDTLIRGHAEYLALHCKVSSRASDFDYLPRSTFVGNGAVSVDLRLMKNEKQPEEWPFSYR